MFSVKKLKNIIVPLLCKIQDQTIIEEQILKGQKKSVDLWSHTDLPGSLVSNLSCTLESLGELRSHPRYSELIGLGGPGPQNIT